MREALGGLEGVTMARVELETGWAIVGYREGTLVGVQAIEAIEAAVVLPNLRRWLAMLPRTRRPTVSR